MTPTTIKRTPDDVAEKMLGLIDALDAARRSLKALRGIDPDDRPEWEDRDLDALAYQLRWLGGQLSGSLPADVSLSRQAEQGSQLARYVQQLLAAAREEAPAISKGIQPK